MRLAAAVTLVGTLIYVILPPELKGFADYRLLGPAFLIPVSFLSLVLVWQGHAGGAYQTLLWGVMLAVTASSALVAGLRTGLVFVYPALVIGAMALGPRIVVLIGATAIAAVIGIGSAEHAGLLPTPRLSSTFILCLAYVLVLLVLTTIAAAMVREQKRWRDRSARASAELERSLQDLTERERELRLITDNVPALVCAYDGFVCRFANPRYAEFFGFTTETIVGRHLREVVGEAAFEHSRTLVERVLAGEPVSYRGNRSSPAFGERHMDIKLMPDGRGGFHGLFLDITDQVRGEEALRESEAQLREAQRIGHVGSWALDLATQRMSWSEELYRIYERSPNDFGGTWKDLLGLVHPDDASRLREAWREAGQAEGGFELRHRILTPDGRTKHLHVRFEVFRDGKGKPVRAIGTAQDVTDQVLAREENQRLNAELEKRVEERTAELKSANRELESFAYSISHDLRAPLRGIDGFSHLLAEEYGDRLDEQGRGYLERVRRAAQRMGALIDDILELSRVTRRQMVRVRVDLSRMAAELLDELRQADPGRQVEARVTEGIGVQGDPQLLRVMMQNLLENAWKYSGKTDRPRIEFGRETEGGEPCLFVRDNGAGFDMRYAGRLFAPFQRLHKPEDFEGTGIGLATVARIVQRHGGQIRAEAEPGRGATFRFTIAGSVSPAQDEAP